MPLSSRPSYLRDARTDCLSDEASENVEPPDFCSGDQSQLRPLPLLPPSTLAPGSGSALSAGTGPISAYRVSHHGDFQDDDGALYSFELERDEREARSPRPRQQPCSRHSSGTTTLATLANNRSCSRKRESSYLDDSLPHPNLLSKTGPEAIVTFNGPTDPYRPQNWGFRKKVLTTALYGFTTMGSTFASSVYSTGTAQVANEFNVSFEVSALGTSLLLFGFALGPLIWAPLSEVYGRKLAVLTPYFLAAIFAFASGTGKDIRTILISRFFLGFFGSAPVTNTGGVMGDIWAPQQRGVAVVGYALAVVGGPTLGPLVGGAICQSSLGWRYTEFVTGIFMMFMLTLDVLLLDESFAPVLLIYKARRLRYTSGNWALHAKHEEWDVRVSELMRKYGVRPFQMLCTPICFLVALYASFVFGLLYANLASFPIVFEETRGWNQVQGGLPFLALLLGILFGASLNLYNQRYYHACFVANGRCAVPEARLPPMLVGSVFFAGGLFVFSRTTDPTVPWIAPLAGCVLIGIGFFTIFQAALNYLIDTFHRYGASAIAASTFLRSVFAGAFPMFIRPMFGSLGNAYAITVFAGVAVLLIPIPFLFFAFGKRLRAKGVWSRESLGPVLSTEEKLVLPPVAPGKAEMA